MKAKKNLPMLAMAVAFVVLHGHTLWAGTTVAVGTCRPTIPHFATLTAAVVGAPAGGTILVCPGTYAEQFTIAQNLTITGISSGNNGLPVIVPPVGGLVQNIVSYNVPSGFLENSPLAVQIIVSPGVTASISNIALDASNNLLPNCPGIAPVGIYFADSSGTLNHLSVRNQTASCTSYGFAGLYPYPFGDGVFVQSDGSLPAVVTVEDSSFYNDGWMAVHADGPDANVSIKNNTAVGPGTTYGNGILVEDGAGSPAITGNAETNAAVNGQPIGYWGILMQGNCPGGTVISQNTVSNTNLGIVVDCNTNIISGNRIFDSQLDGIQVCGSGNTIQGNTISASGGAGVNLLQGCADQNNLVSANTVNGACAGVQVGTDAIGNTIGTNQLYNVASRQVTGNSCN